MRDFVYGLIMPWFIWFNIAASLSIMCFGSGFYRLDFNKKPKGHKEILESLWEFFKLVWVFPVQFVKENILGIWE